MWYAFAWRQAWFPPCWGLHDLSQGDNLCLYYLFSGLFFASSPLHNIRDGITTDGKVWSYPRSWIGGNGAKRTHKGKWLKP